MSMYTPSEETLKRYAQVMVRFGIGDGKGVKKGDVVYLVGTEIAKPLFVAIYNEIIEAGGHVIQNYMPGASDRYQTARNFYERAKDHQLDFFPAAYMKGLVENIDHYCYIIAEANPRELEGIDPKKIMRKGQAMKPFMDWRTAKENKGKLSWTLCLYGTPEMAKEAGLTEEEYWAQIRAACFLDEQDPVRKWKEVFKDIAVYKRKLNALSPKIEKLHVTGPDADLWITLGENRQWLGGGSKNIPTFEIYTSPDWRGTEGWIAFNQPLYRYGTKIEGIRLEFKKGVVVKATATKNEAVLKAMVNTKNADKIGEYSLTDARHSRITKTMAHTLYDENIGGTYGNTHLALGNAYRDTYTKDLTRVSEKQWEQKGFNNSSVHTDIISTAPRTVTAHLKNGTTKIIYKDGNFVL